MSRKAKKETITTDKCPDCGEQMWASPSGQFCPTCQSRIRRFEPNGKHVDDSVVVESRGDKVNSDETCKECHGDGDVECTECDGEGNIGCYHCGAEMECEECGGKGCIECDECEGVGYVSREPTE